MQRGNLRVCKCSSELYYNKYYTVQILWSFLVECVYVIIITFAIYNYHYYVYTLRNSLKIQAHIWASFSLIE